MTELFHDHLLHSGFPQASLTESLALAQKLPAEDLVAKALQRDLPVLSLIKPEHQNHPPTAPFGSIDRRSLPRPLPPPPTRVPPKKPLAGLLRMH